MLALSSISILFFLLSTIISVESKESYVIARNDNRKMDSRSSRDSDRNIRRVLDNNSMRFGRRSDLPPLFNRLQYDDEDMPRVQRAGIDHLRFGKSGSNFLRFGRAQNTTSNELRVPMSRDGRVFENRNYRQGSNFMRFGRDVRYKKGSDSKKPSDNFMRFGRDYEEDFEAEDNASKTDVNDDESLAAFLNEIACKMDTANCGFQ